MELNHTPDNPMTSLFATVMFAMAAVFLRFIHFINDFDKAILEPLAHFGSICASGAAVVSFMCMVYPPFKDGLFNSIHVIVKRKKRK